MPGQIVGSCSSCFPKNPNANTDFQNDIIHERKNSKQVSKNIVVPPTQPQKQTHALNEDSKNYSSIDSNTMIERQEENPGAVPKPMEVKDLEKDILAKYNIDPDSLQFAPKQQSEVPAPHKQSLSSGKQTQNSKKSNIMGENLVVPSQSSKQSQIIQPEADLSSKPETFQSESDIMKAPEIEFEDENIELHLAAKNVRSDRITT